MRRLKPVKEGERIIGPLTERHLELRKKAMGLADDMVRALSKIEADCQIGDREPTDVEKKQVYDLNHAKEIANLEMWKAITDNLRAWELPIGIRMDRKGVAVLVETEMDPVSKLLSIMDGGRGRRG